MERFKKGDWVIYIGGCNSGPGYFTIGKKYKLIGADDLISGSQWLEFREDDTGYENGHSSKWFKKHVVWEITYTP